MIERGSEIKKADEAITEAIQYRLSLGHPCGHESPDRSSQIMMDYVIVVESITPMDDGNGDMEFWDLIYRDSSARSTVAIGLLTKGMDIIRGIGSNERTDEEDG
jgi:hypothetical protein